MTLPTFVCIGAQRCGTTWLYDCLSGHKEVFLPDIKDVHFFRSWQGKPALYETHGINYYEGLFAGTSYFSARGDISAGLLSGEGVAARMYETLPDCRLIVILRNPADRAHSHYHFLAARHQLPHPLRELVDSPELKDPHEILCEGFYARHLEMFLRLYPRERFLILLYDDLVADPRGFFRRVCNFIEVDQEFEPGQLYRRSNAAPRYRIRALYHWNLKAASFLFTSRMNVFRKVLKGTGLPTLFRQLNEGSSKKQVLDSQTREALLSYYRSDIERLAHLLGRDLSAWLRSTCQTPEPVTGRVEESARMVPLPTDL